MLYESLFEQELYESFWPRLIASYSLWSSIYSSSRSSTSHFPPAAPTSCTAIPYYSSSLDISRI